MESQLRVVTNDYSRRGFLCNEANHYSKVDIYWEDKRPWAFAGDLFSILYIKLRYLFFLNTQNRY